jgi:hypothetical protein
MPDWQDLTAAEQDFLARVSIAVRNRRSQQNGRPFQADAPADIVAVPGFPGARFRAEGAEALAALTATARAHLANADPGGVVELGASYRPFEEQLKQWPMHLKRYFLRHRDDLASELQDGRAIDFRTRSGAKGPLLSAGTEAANKAAWCAMPLFQWLAVHAREFGFVQEDIDEPWHWVYDPVAAQDPSRAALIAPSCRV